MAAVKLYESSRPDPITVWADRIGRVIYIVVAGILLALCVVAVLR